MANNSSGARSVLYGKTIDHVRTQQVVLADGSTAALAPLAGQALAEASRGESIVARALRDVPALAQTHADEIDRRFPKVLRRVGGYNLDAFVDGVGAGRSVAADGGLGGHARLRDRGDRRAGAAAGGEGAGHARVRRPARGAGRDAGGAAPSSVGGRGDGRLHPPPRPRPRHARRHAACHRRRREPVPAAAWSSTTTTSTCCCRGSTPSSATSPGRARASRVRRLLEAAAQARVWHLREAALGLSMAMPGDAKALSFVEDTAVAPERLRDYIARFQAAGRPPWHRRRRLRPRLGRVPARAAGGQPQDRGRRRPVRGDRPRRRRPGARVRRRPVGRARRRTGPRRLQRADVRHHALPGVPHREAHLRSRRPLQPRPDRRHAGDHLAPALRPGLPDARAAQPLRLRERRLRPRRRGVQRRRRLPQDPRGHDVPLVHGHARRGALDARTGQRAAPGDDRPARSARASTTPACTRRSTSVSSAARARASAR